MTTGMTVENLIKRDRIILLFAVGGLLAISWVLMLHHHAPSVSTHEQVLAPHAHGLDPGEFALAFSMWLVMMIAMMLPPVLPWILFFASTHRNNQIRSQPWFSTALFIAGYFTVWSGYCLAAAAVQLGLQDFAILHPGDLKAGPSAGGALLLLAGIFQFTPLKAACLKHCRTPLSYFLAYWKDGPAGAFGMGFRHGAYCLGCCWALMGLSFALGIMNLLWMAIMTVLLCIEKIAPGGEIFSRSFGVLFGLWGVWLLATGGAFG